MRLSTINVFLAFLVFGGPAANANFCIVLDPGHGGADKGAVHSHLQESELVLKVAAKVKELLERNPSLQVSMTRTQDRSVSLAERVKFAEELKADLFVSLHANAATDPRAKGAEFFFQNNLPPDEESLYLASQENQIVTDIAKDTSHDNDELSKKGDIASIIEDLRRQTRLRSSLSLTQTLTHVWENENKLSQATIKQAPFYVISKTSMPSILIEVGFLTNPKEAQLLSKSEYQNALAQKIYKALLAYKEKMDNSASKTLN